MVLLGAGFLAMSRGAVGAVIGVVCIVVAIVWKVWGTRFAGRIMERRKAAAEQAPTDDTH